MPSSREFSTELLPFAYAQTTVCVYPNNCSRTPKQPCGYTQTLLLNFMRGTLRQRGSLLRLSIGFAPTRLQALLTESGRNVGLRDFLSLTEAVHYLAIVAEIDIAL